MTALAWRLRALVVLVSSVLVVSHSVVGCAEPKGEMLAKLTHDFTNESDGPVGGTADSSQLWTQTASRRAAVPVVVGGGFTDADTQPGASASYLTARLAGPATHVTADFDFGPAGTDGENVTLLASSKDLPGGTDGVGPLTDLVMHVAFTETGWIFSTVSAGSATLLTLKTVDYENYSPKTALQKVSVVLDQEHNTARVQGADGRVTDVSHPSIGAVRAPFVTFEVYYGAADSDKRTNIRRVAADSLPISAPTG